MAIPSKATVFKQQMDPADRVEWQIDADAVLLEAGETIDTYTLVLDSAAVALGISISTATGYEAAVVNAGLSIRFWLEVLDPTQVAFDSVVQAALTLTINTSSTPARRRQRTFVVEITNL